MKFDLKNIDVAGDFLSDHTPENLEFFSLWLTLDLGFSNESGSSLYQINVCTPDWIKYAIKYESNYGALWGRHLLIVERFDDEKIESLIKEKLQEISNDGSIKTPLELNEKFARYAHWEFEDYVSIG